MIILFTIIVAVFAVVRTEEKRKWDIVESHNFAF